ncbi:hypothetical protein D3C80_1562770 [compost metagenome]
MPREAGTRSEKQALLIGRKAVRHPVCDDRPFAGQSVEHEGRVWRDRVGRKTDEHEVFFRPQGDRPPRPRNCRYSLPDIFYGPRERNERELLPIALERLR